MTSLFSSPSMPTPKPPPPAPDISGGADAALAERRRLAAATGRSSMILNPVADKPAASQQKMLLGA